MSENFNNNTEKFCDLHTVPRRECGCLWSGPSGTTGKRGITLLKASSVKMKRPKWLFKKTIPLKSVTLLAGREGLGKSTLWAYWVAEVTHGRTGSEDISGPASVLIVANEDSIESTIVPRLKAAGANLELVYFARATTQLGTLDSVTLPIDQELLVKEAVGVEAKLIVLDPLVSALDGKLDSHKDHSIRQALDPLNRIADRSECAVIGIVHLNKGVSLDVLDRVIGSRAFTAAARSVIVLERDSEDETDTRRLVIHAKSNLAPRDIDATVIELKSTSVETEEGPTELAAIKILGTRPVDLSDVLKPRDSKDVNEQSEAGAWLLEYLTKAGGEAASSDVMKRGLEAGYSKDLLKRARDRTGVITTRTKGFQPSTIWSLPQSEQSEQSVQLVETEHNPALTVGIQLVQLDTTLQPSALTTPTASTEAWG